MAISRLCSIPNCNKPRTCKDWCGAHYVRWKRHGDPLGGRPPYGEIRQFYQDVVLAYEGNECLIWPFGRVSGYGKMFHNGRHHVVSNLLCEKVNGPKPTPAHEAAHSCGKGKQGCVTKGHLQWKTPVENAADKLIHGTSSRGERQGRSKLTEQDVLEILELKGSLSASVIAKRYGVTRSNITAIYLGKNWKWINAA